MGKGVSERDTSLWLHMTAWRNLVGNRGEMLGRTDHKRFACLLRSLDFILKIIKNYWGILRKHHFIMGN